MDRTTLALVALVSLAGIVGVASAVTMDPWDGSTVSENITTTNDTEAIEVMAENITNGSASVSVSYWDNGTATEITTGTLQTSDSAGNYTDTYRYEPSNLTYDTYLVEVTGDGADSLTISSVNGTAAGGSGVLPSSNRAIGFGVLSVVVVGFLYLNRQGWEL